MEHIIDKNLNRNIAYHYNIIYDYLLIIYKTEKNLYNYDKARYLVDIGLSSNLLELRGNGCSISGPKPI